ncbi:MAG: hypothetical protein IPM47_15095 [Sphingobacteriales bacterium]|nr:MAG: hypothetical protein IPM47_15095 [Sphingobacteriales bacterium]
MKQVVTFLLILSSAVLMTTACNAQQTAKEKQHQNENSEVQTGKSEESPVSSVNENPSRSHEFNHGYMVLPGFTPTGNPETDDMNYAKAKKEFVAQNPDDYIQKMNDLTETAKKEWLSQQVPSNTQRDSNLIQISKSRFDNMTEAEKKRITDHPQQFNIVED